MEPYGTVWSSNMSGDVKISFFQATVESILLYGCECWTLIPTLQKSLDGCYTRMLRMVLNVDWRDHVSNKTLYGMLPRISQKIAYRRMGMAGHCCRHPELPASRLVLWEPTHGVKLRGKQRRSYVGVLRRDAGAETTTELAACIKDSEDWRRRRGSRLQAT